MILVIACVASFAAGAALVYLWRASKISELSALLSAERSAKEHVLADIQKKMTEAVDYTRKSKAETDVRTTDLRSSFEETVHKLQEDKGRVQGAIQQFLDLGQQLRTDIHTIQKVFSFSSGVRGALGEMLLQRILEDNGMVPGTHFDTQWTAVGAEQGEVRPDFVIHLPHGRKLIVDSKEVTSEYFLGAKCADEAQQKAHFQRLVNNLRANVVRLSRKEYQSALDPEIPFVVMYVSNESAIRTALAMDPELFQEAYSKYRVFLASPMTIIPLIQLIRFSWRQRELADNARELGVVVEQLGDRLATFVGHLHHVGGGIRKAAEAWDAAVSSWKKKVSPQVEKIRSMGGKIKETADPELVDANLSQLSLPKDPDLLQ